MAKKRKVFLHVGMPGAGDIIEVALVHHRDALFELGIDVPARSAEETFLSAVDVLREHKAWGFARKEVEGQWADVCRRAWMGKQTVAVSLPLVATASRPEIDLLLDTLAGMQVHVVLTASPDDDIDDIAARWGAAVRKPERLHVIRLDEPSPKKVWKAFGKVAGFGTASLGLADVPEPVGARPLSSLDEARREIERLARRNRSLERWRHESDRKRKKLKRRLSSVA
ncbi:hypothetical protein [Nocardioides bizhenqiangii]|uniref:Uncharacterized protein n=1 Tax=Nocardioides bizhenqiangii TaxID=3095076 RepID=A0ABZ0ZRR9_9ACTN|nr:MULTISPECIES: hypothetical protein [unclassified Nocardioides]MDZ5619826.1 hypothetical protein [Nocardioides sp. HM23]WQQ26168.1 hypothetical protein SHK19_19670 [Nocardioides sp. HM61]